MLQTGFVTSSGFKTDGQLPYGLKDIGFLQ